MTLLHTDAVDSLLATTTPDGDEIIAEMEAQAEESGFPTVDPGVGAFLRVCARFTDAESVFEFGSGYGYSAYCVAPALGSDGRIVLTKINEAELAQAESYLKRGGYADRARFELGDALSIFDQYEGPFDLVLLDHQSARYIDGFETVREKVSDGGMIVADNVFHSRGMDPADLEAALAESHASGDDSTAADIAAYCSYVRDDPDFETIPIPLCEGLFVSVRT